VVVAVVVVDSGLGTGGRKIVVSFGGDSGGGGSDGSGVFVDVQ
jgi:hypothetical protein